MGKKRKSFDSYFVEMANVVAKRSTCSRARVGCVIVNDKHIISCGYNGSLPKSVHCDDDVHMMVNGHCVRTVHAEVNAISHAAKRGISCDGSTAYITHAPCWSCFKLLVMAGIVCVIYEDEYFLSDIVLDAAKECGVYLSQFEDNKLDW